MLQIGYGPVYIDAATDTSISGAASIIKIVNSLPATGSDKYLYGLLMNVLDKDNRGIVQFFVWDAANSDWLATGAYSIDIDPSTLMLKEDFQFNSATGVLNIVTE